MIVELMDLDSERTVALLLDKNRIPSEVVVEKLQNHERLLFKVNTTQVLHIKLGC